MRHTFRLITLVLACSGISGCLALAVGAAGGYYVHKNYKVKVHKKTNAPSEQQEAKSETDDKPLVEI